MKQTIFECQGYFMRSHSETRWAEMLDALSICWIYEPGLVKTRHGMYLPDFYLPYAGIYLEVKGPKPSQVEIEKARDVQDSTGIPVVFAYGDMFLEGAGGVQGGFFMVLGPKAEAWYSTYEFGPIIQRFLGREQWKRYMRVGIKRQGSPIVHARDVLRERLLSTMDRSAREQHLARQHGALNESRVCFERVPSPAERGLNFFFSKTALRKEAA